MLLLYYNGEKQCVKIASARKDIKQVFKDLSGYKNMSKKNLTRKSSFCYELSPLPQQEMKQYINTENLKQWKHKMPEEMNRWMHTAFDMHSKQ